MKIYTISAQQWVVTPIGEVFAFFEKPENLGRLTPPGLRFRILTPSPIPMNLGRVIDYQIRVLGVAMRWRSLITTYDPPRGFVDEQIKGPYSFWHHRHRFSEHRGGTLLEDEVHYALPLGVIGTVAHTVLVRNYLHHIFAYRGRLIASLFGAGARGEDAPVSTSITLAEVNAQ